MEDKRITIEEAYAAYTQTKFIVNGDGSITHVSPRGHYTGETLEDFKYKILNDDEFNNHWGLGCTRKLTDDEIVEYYYTYVRKERKWRKDEVDGRFQYFFF